MRYTTIIDLSEFPSLYKNPTIRLVYLHLVLRSGYHDEDRDLISVSLRRLAFEVGITLSACRHALHQLEAAALIRRDGPSYQVRKFVIEKPISPRAKSRRQEQAAAAQATIDQERQKREEERAKYEQMQKALESQGKTSWMVYYESQLAAAQAGDPNAIDYVTKNQETYKQHAAAVAARQSSKQ